MASTAASSTTAVSSGTAQAEARAAVLASLTSAGSHYDAQYQVRARDLSSNAATLASQQAQLERNSRALGKESAKFQKEFDKTTKGLKEFGDLQHWAEMLERDFCVLEETLRLAEGTEREESGSGGSTWR